MTIFTTRGATYTKVMHTIKLGLSRCFILHLAKSNTVPKILRETPKKAQIIFSSPIFTTRGAAYPKAMHTVESGLLRQFFWHLAKSNPTYGSWDIKCWENCGSAAVGAAVAVAAGVQYDSIHYDISKLIELRFVLLLLLLLLCNKFGKSGISICKIWNSGQILMFKVSRQPYRSARHDRIICSWNH